MDIRQILALEANSTSIKKIDEFLSGITPNHRDYPKALAHLAYLSFSLGNVGNAFTLLFNYLEVCIDKEKPTIYNALIKIYYEQKDYENVLQMIETKKKYLPNYNKIAYYEDLIVYYDEVNNSSELIRTLLTYLDDDISDEKRLKALIRLCDEYLANSDFIRFKDKNKLILSLALSLNEDELYQKARYKEAYVFVREASFPRALLVIDEMLETHLKKDLRGMFLALKLEILVSMNEYRRASIFEAEYEYEVEEANLEAKIKFAEQCIILYTALNNRFNKSSYEEKLQVLLEEKKNSEATINKPKKSRVSKQAIELNFIKNQNAFSPINIKEEKEVKTTTIHRDNITMIESGNKLLEISMEFSKLNKEVFSQFRDYLRQFFISLNKLATFDEAYLLTKNNKYYGYHYKKERLYDKKSEILSLNDTILLEVIDLEEEIIIGDTTQTTYVDIITNKFYADLENQSIICLPLSKAALLFSSKSKDILTAKLNYETLKIATAYLDLKWNNEQNELYEFKKNHDYTFMMEHIVSAYKRQYDSYLYLSKTACNLFGCSEVISIDEFYQLIIPEYLFDYRKIILALQEGKMKEASISFASKINGVIRHFEEAFKIDEEGVILSVINEITEKVKDEEKATVMAHFDPVSGAYNKSKLVCDIEELVKLDKFSLFAFNVKGFKNYSDIYGYDFTSQMIFAVAKYLKEYDEDMRVYHLDGDKFILAVIGLNDKRTMTKLGYTICDYLSNKLKKLNYRLNINFEVGILRYPTDTTESDPNDLIDYLLSALSMAHDDGVKSNVACYSKEAYRRQFFQSQLATHVSEAIDNNHLALYYRQVVDVGRNNCDHYYVGLNLSNYAVDEKVIYEVIKKRDMTKLIERYMIHKALFELEEMYKEIKVYMNFSFKVSKETLIDETFKDYLLEQLKFFNIPKTAITICYNDELDDNVYEVLKSLTLNQIMIATSNVEILKQFPVYYFYYKLNKDVKNLENEFITVLKDYCDKHSIRFVLDNVNNKTLIAHFVQVGISLYSGKIYSALLTHKDIIKSFLA